MSGERLEGEKTLKQQQEVLHMCETGRPSRIPMISQCRGRLAGVLRSALTITHLQASMPNVLYAGTPCGNMHVKGRGQCSLSKFSDDVLEIRFSK